MLFYYFFKLFLKLGLCSSLCMMRSIFLKCVNNKNTTQVTENKNMSILVFSNINPYEHNTANDIERAIEATDEIFKNFANNAQIASETKANKGDITRNTPADVATPFPPLNPNQTGYECPTMQKKTATK